MSKEDAKLFEKIRLYIEGGLGRIEKEEVERRLQESRELFDFYIGLKEAIFLKGKGTKASTGLEEKIIGLATGRRTPHLSLIVRFLADRVMVSSGGSDELKYYGAQAAFAYRAGSAPGPVTIERRIADRDLTVVITPSDGGESFGISAAVAGREKLEAILVADGREIETLPDVSGQKMFRSHIPGGSDIKLEFKKRKALLFTIGLKLRKS